MGAFYIHAYTCVRVYHTCMCIYREIKDTGIYTCTYIYVYHVYLVYLEVQGGYKQVKLYKSHMSLVTDYNYSQCL